MEYTSDVTDGDTYLGKDLTQPSRPLTHQEDSHRSHHRVGEAYDFASPVS